jgi:glycosyltransferase involved in cell wall biosynthesis
LKNIEILCIDDGSTDKSSEILKEYGKKDRRIKYLYKKNEGPGPARNLGIKKAMGKYISFLDADDYLEKETLSITYKKAEETNLDILLFNAKPIFDNKSLEQNFEFYKTYYKRNEIYEEVISGEDLLNRQVKNSDFLPHVGFQIIRRDLIINNQNYFIDAYHEDNLFTIKNLLLAKKVFHLNKSLYIRRLRPNSIMTSKKSIRNLDGYFQCILELESFIKTKDFKIQTLNTVAGLLKGMQANGARILLQLEDQDIKNYTKHLTLNKYISFQALFIKLKEFIKKTSDIEHLYSKLEKEYNLEEKKQKKQQKQLQKQLHILKIKLSKLENALSENKTELNLRQQEIKNIKSSKSFKIGKMITYIPRKIKNVFQKHPKKK